MHLARPSRISLDRHCGRFGEIRWLGFTTFKHDAADSTSISTGWVTTLFEDRSGVLWIGNSGGLNRFDPITERFTHFAHDSKNSRSLSNNHVSVICEDHTSTLWVGTKEGLDKFDRDTKTFTHFVPDPLNPRSLSSKYVLSILEDRSERLWIGTEAGGLNRFDRDTESFTRFLHDSQNSHSLNSNHVTAIYEDHTGALWIGTIGGGLNRFDHATQTFTRFVHDPRNAGSLSSNEVQTISEDRSGTLWIGTLGGGLNRFDSEAGEFISYTEDPKNPHSLCNNRVSSICEDRSGALWIGTDNGLNKWDRGQARFTPLTNELENPQNSFHNVIWAICKDRFGALWIGTDNGLFRRTRDDRGKERVTYFTSDPKNSHTLSDKAIYAIFEDQHGTLWIGTGNGLDRYDRANARFIRWANDAQNPVGLGYHQIFSICEDPTSPRTLWIGSGGGLFRLNLDERGKYLVSVFKFDPQNPNSISSNAIRPLLIDRSGVLWVGTRNGGLNKFDREKKQFNRFVHDSNDPNSLSNDVIRSIYEDQKGRLWIGTDGGLNQFDRAIQQFRYYTERDGLPNNAVWGILEDDRGHLWLSTNNGLCRFDPSRSAGQTFKNYTVSDGLAHQEFYRGAYFKSDDGMMFFGGLRGVTMFHPDSIKDNPFIPPVVSTAFKRYNTDAAEGSAIVEKGISVKQAIELSYKDNIISFEFAALSFRNPEKNQYAYKLEDYSDQWIQLGAKREATFTNLDAGEYVLRVKGSNNDGIWNEEGASLKITITPPPWNTWWAYTLYALFITCLFYGIRRYELNRIRLKNQLKLERVEAEKLKELDAMKSRFFANISHEFRTPFTLILAPMDSLLATLENQQARQSLQMMRRNASRLLQLINQLLDLSKLESGKMQLQAARQNVIPVLRGITMTFQSMADRKEIALLFHSEVEALELYFDHEKFEKIFFNLLSNAFKFTRAGVGGKVSVTVGREQRA